MVIRLVAAMLLVCSLLASACFSETASSPEQIGTSIGQVAPEPTADIAGMSLQPNVVIAPTPVPAGPRPLVVATLLGETGVLGPLDGAALAGVIAEIERLNDEGGVLGRPVKLRRFDTNSRVSLTERLVKRFVENPPDVIITSCDADVARPALEFADENGLITISPCGDDAGYLTGELGSRNYTMGAPAGPRGAIAAAEAFERYGATAMVLRDVTSPEATAFCDGFERAFRELGGAVIYRDEFNYDTLAPMLDRVDARAGQTSFITLCSHVPGEIDAAPSIILNLRTRGFGAPIVGGSTFDRPGWFALVPTLGELLFISWSSMFGNDPDSSVNELVRSIQQSDPLSLGGSTILGAESVQAWARAVETVRDASPDRVASALASFNDEVFSTGQVSFATGARMDLGRTYRVLRVLDGELTVIGIAETED